MSRTPKAYKNLAQGGGSAEPWVLVVKKRVALKERKNRSTAERKGRAIFEDDDKLRRRGFSTAPSAAPTRHGGCFSPCALQSSAL
jgi:hypothetical protein